MESKTKTISLIGGILLAVILVWIGIRFLGWAIRALIFGGGGLLIGFILGAVWMYRRNKAKSGAGKKSAGGVDI